MVLQSRSSNLRSVLAEAVEHVRRVAQDKGKKAAIFCADGQAAG